VLRCKVPLYGVCPPLQQPEEKQSLAHSGAESLVVLTCASLRDVHASAGGRSHVRMAYKPAQTDSTLWAKQTGSHTSAEVWATE
jgi:hypothetical protein